MTGDGELELSQQCGRTVESGMSQRLKHEVTVEPEFTHQLKHEVTDEPEVTHQLKHELSGETEVSRQLLLLTAAEKTHILVSLIDDLHDCADIMQFRSLPGQTEIGEIA